MKTAGVRFKRAGKIYTFEAGELELKSGEQVVVETERGMALGLIATEPQELESKPKQPLKKIVRVAEEKDAERLDKNAELESQAKQACEELAQHKGLDMKVLDVECLFDRSKVVFFFVAEGRVDFRELVRDLARRFHTRIEMRQVGVRDEAKMVGGLGCCGRELCCSTWLSDFAPISVRMAKSQNISLNPAKISGICGRLMCCLAYENKMYEEMSRGMPKVGKRVTTHRGEGKVIRRNALEGNFVVIGEGGEMEIDLEQYKVFLETGEVPPQEEAKTPEKSAEKKSGERGDRGGRQQRGGGRQGGRGRQQRKGGKPGEQRGEKAADEIKDKVTEKKSGEASGEQGQSGEKKGDRPPRRRRRRRRPSQAREKKDNG